MFKVGDLVEVNLSNSCLGEAFRYNPNRLKKEFEKYYGPEPWKIIIINRTLSMITIDKQSGEFWNMGIFIPAKEEKVKPVDNWKNGLDLL